MIMELTEMIKTLSSINYFPHAIPLNYNDSVGTVRISPSYRTVKGGIASVEVQIIIRALHPEESNRLATELQHKLDKKTGFNIGETRVILAEVKNAFPIYIGKDENDRYKHSIDITLLIEK